CPRIPVSAYSVLRHGHDPLEPLEVVGAGSPRMDAHQRLLVIGQLSDQLCRGRVPKPGDCSLQGAHKEAIAHRVDLRLVWNVDDHTARLHVPDPVSLLYLAVLTGIEKDGPTLPQEVAAQHLIEAAELGAVL